MLMSNERYDKLQKIMRTLLPLITMLSAFLTELGNIWGFKWMGLVTATLAAFSVFLGQLLTVSSKKYKEAKEADTEVLDNEGEEVNG